SENQSRSWCQRGDSPMASPLTKVTTSDRISAPFVRFVKRRRGWRERGRPASRRRRLPRYCAFGAEHEEGVPDAERWGSNVRDRTRDCALQIAETRPRIEERHSDLRRT